jgi:hypothetical protein
VFGSSIRNEQRCLNKTTGQKRKKEKKSRHNNIKTIDSAYDDSKQRMFENFKPLFLFSAKLSFQLVGGFKSMQMVVMKSDPFCKSNQQSFTGENVIRKNFTARFS